MTDPWQLFCLDPQTATEKDLKRAYAKLLKANRPDANPQGFRIVYDAYQTALHTIRSAAQSEASALAGQGAIEISPDQLTYRFPLDGVGKNRVSFLKNEAQPLAPVPEQSKEEHPASPPTKTSPPELAEEAVSIVEPPILDEPLKQEILSADINLEQSPDFLKTLLLPSARSAADSAAWGQEKALNELKHLLNGWHFPWRLPPAFEAVLRSFEDAKTPPARRIAKWKEVFGGNIELLANRMPDQPLLSLIQNDELSLCYEVTDQWFAHGNWKRLSNFGRGLLGASQGTFSHTLAEYAAFLATKLAIAEPALADLLASRAYEILEPAQRAEFVGDFDPRLWLGKQLISLPRRIRRFWIENLARHSRPLDARKMRVRRYVLATVRKAPNAWSGWNSIKAYMTPDFQTQTNRWIEWHAKGSPVEMMYLFDSRFSALIFRILKVVLIAFGIFFGAIGIPLILAFILGEK